MVVHEPQWNPPIELRPGRLLALSLAVVATSAFVLAVSRAGLAGRAIKWILAVGSFAGFLSPLLLELSIRRATEVGFHERLILAAGAAVVGIAIGCLALFGAVPGRPVSPSASGASPSGTEAPACRERHLRNDWKWV